MKYIFAILFLIASHLYGQESFLIRDVKLFDGENTLERTDVLIENGVLIKIGSIKAKKAENATIIDGSGKSIIPGLINCHVHAWVPYHLKNAMQAGVFAVLDMNTPIHPDSLDRYNLEDGYAKFYTTGYAATVEGGHGTQFGYKVPTIGEELSPTQYVAEAIARGSDYIKILYEPQMPALTVQQVNEIVAASKKGGLLSVAHVSRLEYARDIINSGVDGFVHVWRDPPASQSFLDSLADKQMFVVPTISVREKAIEYYRGKRIKFPYSTLETLQKEVKRLHDAGVTVLTGTDPPNFLMDYGSSVHTELSHFVAGGLTPLEALKAATSHPNKIFQLGEIGIIQEGAMANFNLIDGDPLENIEDVSNITAIWAGGKKIK